jgi:hypothetical protein
MRQIRSPDEYRVPVLATQERVVRDPSQGNLSHGQAMRRHNRANRRERVKVGRLPVSVAVVLNEISLEC